MSATSVQDGDQSRAVMPRQFRTLFISDLHLGARACQAEAFLDFLRYYDTDTIYLVGDIIDFWSVRRSPLWLQSHNALCKIYQDLRPA